MSLKGAISVSWRLVQTSKKFSISVYQDESSDEADGDDLMDDLQINGDGEEDSASYNSEEESEEDNDQMIVSDSDG